MTQAQTMRVDWWTSRAEPAFRMYRGVARQPNWVVRAALSVFVFILAIPIIVLVLLAVLATAVVFGCLVAFVAVRQWIARLLGRGSGGGMGVRGGGVIDDGSDERRNVRVIRRDE